MEHVGGKFKLSKKIPRHIINYSPKKEQDNWRNNNNNNNNNNEIKSPNKILGKSLTLKSRSWCKAV